MMNINQDPRETLSTLLTWILYISCSALVAKIFSTLVWRLWFHPLAAVPGPRVAAVCSLWEAWQDIGRGGELARAVFELHREYNSDIVRISPNHVHINDPDFYFQMFKVNTDFHKDRAFYEKMAVPHSLLTVDTKTARSIRSKVTPIIVPRDWGTLKAETHSIAKQASDQCLLNSRRGEETDLFLSFRCISTDIICSLCFGLIPDFVKKPQRGVELFRVLDMSLEGFWYMIHIPLLMTPALILPLWILKFLLPGVVYFRQQGGEWVDKALKRSNEASNAQKNIPPSIIGTLNPTPGRMPSHLGRERLIDQANTFVFAGVDTTSTMLVLTFHKVLSSPDILKRLQEELRDATSMIQHEFYWKKVRQLPYLTAVIKEGLRLGTIVPGRLPRAVPPEGIDHKGTFIPGGTTVSSTIYSMHHNSTVFPDPEKFNPDRWLADNSVELEKYNVAFSKGTRNCIGMNLAYLEIYTVLAVFFCRFDMQLEHPAAGKDIGWSDHFAKSLKDTVRVKVVKDHWND